MRGAERSEKLNMSVTDQSGGGGRGGVQSGQGLDVCVCVCVCEVFLGEILTT